MSDSLNEVNEQKSQEKNKPTEFTVQFYIEDCCEECNEVIHNHFDCPICKDGEFAGTSIYSDAVYTLEEHEMHFSCEDCGTKFEILDNSDIDNIVIRIKNEA